MRSCRLAVLIGLAAVGLGPALAQPPAGDLKAVLDACRQRRAGAASLERELWDCLALLAEHDLGAGRHRDEWRHLAAPGVQIARVTGERPLDLDLGREPLVPVPVATHLWVLASDRAVYLLAIPDGGPATAAEAHARLLRQAADAPADPADVRQKKEAVRAELSRGRRPEAAALVLVRMHSFAAAPRDLDIRRVPGGFQIGEGGKTLRVPTPTPAELAAAFGQPFRSLVPGETPPGPRLYVALDWSEYLASPGRRDRVLAELQHALKEVEPAELVEGAVFLHAGNRSLAWPLADLRAGRLPDAAGGLAPHAAATLETLADLLLHAEASRPAIARLYFVTWNPETTLPADLLGRDLRRTPEHAGLVARAERLPLFVLQLGERRLPCLASLAGRRYYTFPYRESAAPGLTLPREDE